MSDLYAQLGLTKNASMEDIKRAYRKESLVKHPDRPGGNKEEFQKLQGAFEILSDPEKRGHYDATGQIPQEGGGPGPGGMPDLAAMFGGMFGGGFPGGFPGMQGGFPGGMPFPFFGGGPQQNVKAARGPNKIHEIGLSLADLYNGKTFTLNMKRDALCGRCAGRGGTRVESCGQCGGRGFRMRGQQMGPVMTMIQEPCGSCGQTGQRILEECGECRGRRVVERESVLDVAIEPGMQDGDRVTFVGQCSESPQHAQPGDVILIIRTTESDAWIREGAELTHTIELSLAEMLLGWQRVIQGHPSNQPLNVAWTGGVLHEGDVLTLVGQGMPSRGGGGKGNLKLVCRTKRDQGILSDEQRSALKMIWPDWKEVATDGFSIPVHL